MYVKIRGHTYASSVFLRCAYLIADKVPSHCGMVLKRFFVGPENGDVHAFFVAAARAEETSGRRGRSRIAFFEIIISVPKGEKLSDGEIVSICLKVIDCLLAESAIVGLHRRSNGDLDVHVLVANDTIDGKALSGQSVLISTNRKFRNLEVVVREAVERAQIEMNKERTKRGEPKITSIVEIVADRIARKNHRHREATKAVVPARSDNDESTEATVPGGLTTMRNVDASDASKPKAAIWDAGVAHSGPMPRFGRELEPTQTKAKEESAPAKEPEPKRDWIRLTDWLFALMKQDRSRLTREEEKRFKEEYLRKDGALKDSILREVEDAERRWEVGVGEFAAMIFAYDEWRIDQARAEVTRTMDSPGLEP